MTRSDEAGPSPMASDGPMTKGRFAVAVVLCLLGIAILAILGTWQMQRLAWKEDLIARIDSRIDGVPEPLAAIEARHAGAGDVDYFPVRLSGRFLHAYERHMLSTFSGAAGWNVFTPLVLDDGRTIFVNRGFVPYDRKDPATRPEGQVEGLVEIVGLARNAPVDRPGDSPVNDIDGNVFFWRGLEDLKAGLPAEVADGMLPFLVDKGEGAAPGGLPVGGTTIVQMTNNHLQYAFTWYGIGAVLVVMLAMLVIRQIRAVGKARDPRSAP